MKIVKRGEDAFLLFWELPTGPDGKRRQRTETFHSGLIDASPAERLKAARDRWTVVRAELVKGTAVEPDRVTVGELCDRWFNDVFLLRGPAEQTKAQYESTIRNHIVPAIGHVRVQQLTTPQVQAMVSRMARKDGKPGQPSARQRRLALMLVRQILHQAEAWQIVHRNVARFAEAPKGGRTEIRFWEAHEVQQFLAAAKGHRLYGLFALGLASGMRLEELLGLRQGAVDWRRGCVHVRSALTQVRGKMVETDLKTARSRRTIALGPATMETLAAHLQRMRVETMALESDWTEQGLVFPSEVGTPLATRNVERTFAALCRRAGVSPITPHGMRHTHATQLLAAGVPAHVVSERLGHSSVAFTLSVYAHVLPHQQDLAARVMDFGEQGNRSGNMPPIEPPRA